MVLQSNNLVLAVVIISEQHVSVEIPKNQSFVDGFWIHWKLYNFEDIPPDMILIVLHVGNQTWEVTDPFSLSEFVELSITQEKTEISVVITVRNMWTITETLVLTAQPTGVYKFLRRFGDVHTAVGQLPLK